MLSNGYRTFWARDMLKNDETTYGWLAILLHWVVALVVFGLFGLGLYMTSLGYYDPLYRSLPQLHKGVGVLLFFIVVLRLVWRWINPRPRPEPGLSRFERTASEVVHGLLYLLLFAIMCSGYLISTADGRPIEVFGLFSLPATITSIPQQEDVAGLVHLVLAIVLMALVVLHALGALKHHFIDRDRTLLRMLGMRRGRS